MGKVVVRAFLSDNDTASLFRLHKFLKPRRLRWVGCRNLLGLAGKGKPLGGVADGHERLLVIFRRPLDASETQVLVDLGAHRVGPGSHRAEPACRDRRSAAFPARTIVVSLYLTGDNSRAGFRSGENP